MSSPLQIVGIATAAFVPVLGPAIGSTIVGGLGIAAGTTAASVAMTAGWAVAGAVAGGLTAAVTGGDIVNGILMGAAGGGIAGGLSEAFAGGSVIANTPEGNALVEAASEGPIDFTKFEYGVSQTGQAFEPGIGAMETVTGEIPQAAAQTAANMPLPQTGVEGLSPINPTGAQPPAVPGAQPEAIGGLSPIGFQPAPVVEQGTEAVGYTPPAGTGGGGKTEKSILDRLLGSETGQSVITAGVLGGIQSIGQAYAANQTAEQQKEQAKQEHEIAQQNVGINQQLADTQQGQLALAQQQYENKWQFGPNMYPNQGQRIAQTKQGTQPQDLASRMAQNKFSLPSKPSWATVAGLDFAA